MYRSIRGKKNQYGAKPNGLNDRDDSRWITPHLIELHGHWHGIPIASNLFVIRMMSALCFIATGLLIHGALKITQQLF